MRTFTGTYAFMFKGTSSAIFGPSADPWLIHWDAKIAPIAGVGVFTLQPNGSGEGFYWLIGGTLNTGLTPVPFYPAITELNEDCTGVIEYEVSLPGPTGPVTYLNKERFVLLQNGRESRGIASQAAVPTAVWHTTAHRISNFPHPGAAHRQNSIRGEYLLSCEGLEPLPVPGPPSVFADTSLMRIQISHNGEFTGIAYVKTGPAYAEIPVAGTFTARPDGTAESTLTSPALPGMTAVARAVFFDEGEAGYLLPLVVFDPNNQPTPQVYGICQVTRIDRPFRWRN
jgi:hypothetical protein